VLNWGDARRRNLGCNDGLTHRGFWNWEIAAILPREVDVRVVQFFEALLPRTGRQAKPGAMTE